jgi:hypothetical protein
MAFNIFATATSDIPLANLDANFTMIGSSAAASTLYPTATTSITYGTTGTTHYFSGTLSATGAVTLSGGTANGVAYLDGSKVLTTGSALTFDGTNLGLGTASPGVKFDIVSANNTSLASVLRVNSNNVAVNTSLAYDGLIGSGQLTVQAGAASALIFGASAAEQMRLTSTGLGIGTSSPGGKLAVTSPAATAAAGVFRSGTTDSVYLTLGRNAYEAGIGVTGATTLLTGASAGDLNIYTNVATGSICLGAGNTGKIQATLDSSGNLGLGVTPSAWSGGIKAIECGFAGNAFAFNTGNTQVGITSNAKYITGWKYANSSVAATFYEQFSGVHTWYNAPSGTAGNAITFTQAMTLDSSGNLLVGTTSYSPSNTGIGLKPNATSWFTASGDYPLAVNRLTSDGIVLDINRSTVRVGSISVTTTATAYNTSSDYRLKENIQPMTGALAKVAALKPCTYKWKADGFDGEGFIAHELAEVAPQCVTGEKDAVDSDGNPQYQGIDTSFLVATLTAAIQELKAEFDAYKSTHP